MITTILLSFIALASSCCVALLTTSVLRSESLAKEIEVQLKRLGEMHRLGFEEVTSAFKRLETRVKEIEDEVL